MSGAAADRRVIGVTRKSNKMRQALFLERRRRALTPTSERPPDFGSAGETAPQGGKDMRQMLSAPAALLVAGLAAPANAQPAREQGPCGPITAACEAAGFVPGGVGSGTGLRADCIVPIMQGRNQPRRARVPLPRIDPQVVADCKASNPRFGQENAPTPDQRQPASAPALPGSPREPQPQAAPISTAPACAAKGGSAPSGIAVVLPSAGPRDRSLDLQALNNPFISGIALQINWRDLEPIQGRPDWSRLDDVFAAAESSGKWVQLLIFPGFFSPPWALEGAETDLFPIQYGPGHGAVTRLPMPWDRVYFGRWFAFLKLLSERYGSSPAFKMMAASGPTSVSAEMTLPTKPPDVAKWRSHGYTPRKYLDAWETVFRVYADDFPNQCISLSAPNLPLLEQDRVVDPAAHMRARQAIIDEAGRTLKERLAIQWSDLHAGHARVEAPDQTSMVIGYSGRVITGLQMRTSAEGDSAVMGADGNPPLALRKSLDKGMASNSAGRHVNYLEIYEPDVLASEMQPVLRYGASLFAR
jgi:hypothetical protein